MSTIVDAIFPMYANYRDNKIIRGKHFNNKSNNQVESLLCYIENADNISTDVLRAQYDDTFQIKGKLEDKAKTNVVGITIAITLIMGASSVLDTIAEKYPNQAVSWIAFILLGIAVIYLLTAGIIAIKVLFDENTAETVSLNSFAADQNVLRAAYDNCIVKNRARNTIRNNCVYSSYECIRNALICLFLILLLSTIPIQLQSTQANVYDSKQEYSFVFSSDAVSYLEKHNVQDAAEQIISKAIKGDNLMHNSDGGIGIIDEENHLFIKFKLSNNIVTVMLIEMYCDS